MAAIKKRSVVVAGHKTSVSLEQPFWDELARLAETRGVSLNSLIGAVDKGRDSNLSSALRVFVLQALKNPPTA